MASSNSPFATILIVEDDPQITILLTKILSQANYTTLTASTVPQALKLFDNNFIDLVLLDWMLGKQSGLDLFRSVRANNNLRDVPFILLTARSSVEDQVYGLDHGVADYITKPFASQTLLARLRSCLLHHPRVQENKISAGDFKLNLSRNQFISRDGTVHLDPSDCRLLQTLMQKANSPIGRARLMYVISNSNQHIETRTVDVHISRIRKRLALIGEERRVATVRSKGYMFDSETS